MRLQFLFWDSSSVEIKNYVIKEKVAFQVSELFPTAILLQQSYFFSAKEKTWHFAYAENPCRECIRAKGFR